MAKRSARVGVVGAGIAGCGAAWALSQAGFEVELFEAGPAIGGNAKTIDWRLDEGGQVAVGLSVLAWPKRLFRNYERLLATLKIATTPVELRFFVRSGAEVFAHVDGGGGGGLAERYANDLKRWRALTRFVGRINRRFNGATSCESLYHLAPLNPMNVIPLRWLARLFGVSREFWDDIVVALLSATFLTTKLDRLPAVILPTITSIVPIDQPALLETWVESSKQVFEALTAGFADQVHTNCAITNVESIEGDGPGVVEISDEHGGRHRFDKLVLACSAPAIDRALVTRRALHNVLLRGVRYCDQGDPTFNHGLVHGDPTVLNATDRNEVLDDYCNYIEVTREADGTRRYENHFVLSSWVPATQNSRTPMLVSYNAAATPDPPHQRRTIDNRGAHPELCTGNLTRALLYRFLQGKDNLYYCGSYATPGNGHDLSLLSGLVVAEQIGAPYPFASDPDAHADFKRLRRIMLGSR